MRPNWTFILILLFLAGCGQSMKNDGRTKPYQEENFFKNKSSARPLVEGTVARGHLKYPTPFFTGKDKEGFVTKSPVPVTKQLLVRGQDRFNIYCAVCHDRMGEGNGMVVQRGFPRPVSFHTERLRKAPIGYFFDVITNGKGAMAPNTDVLDENDRWAIAVYIRALQKSQDSNLNEAPSEIQEKLKALGPKDSGPVYD